MIHTCFVSKEPKTINDIVLHRCVCNNQLSHCEMCVIFIFVMMSRYHACAKTINVSLVIKRGYGQQGKRGLAKSRQT